MIARRKHHILARVGKHGGEPRSHAARSENGDIDLHI
jgi:hypothetical protein